MTTGKVDYTRLSLADVRTGLEAVAREAQTTFGGLDARQLNWRPDATRWSVAQCFDHLLTTNRLMLQAADDALDAARPRTIWQRLPIWPGVLGRMLIRSQSPDAARKMTAPAQARPATSAIAADVIQRFIAQNRDIAESLQRLDEPRARRIMTSPFIKVVTYSVADGFRLLLTHDRRHTEQARRVTIAPGFPTLVIALACVLLGACTSPTRPSERRALATGQWNGTTSQGAAIEFVISPDEKVTSITIGYQFNGCSGSQMFSGLELRTAPDVICIPGPCSGTINSYRAFAYSSSGPVDGARTSLNGLFVLPNRAEGQASFSNYPGCGTATGVTWAAMRH